MGSKHFSPSTNSLVKDPMDWEAMATDEEDEGIEDDDVHLGVTELRNPRFLLRHYFPSKVGGVPAWLDPKDLPEGKSRDCGFCGLPLQFLLQMYAPINQKMSKKDSTFHRTLFVFMCRSMSCLRRDQHEQWKRGAQIECRSVKVFRCQLPRVNPFYSNEWGQKPLTNLVPLCSWCGTWKGDKVCGSCNTARYCSKIHQKIHWSFGHENDCHQMVSLLAFEPSKDNFRARLSSTDKIACNTLWQEYEIVKVTNEKQDDKEDEHSDDDNVHADGGNVDDNEDELSEDEKQDDKEDELSEDEKQDDKEDELSEDDNVHADDGNVDDEKDEFSEDEKQDDKEDELSEDDYVDADNDNVDADEFLMEKAEADDDKKNWASFLERISEARPHVVRYYTNPKAKPLWPSIVGIPSEADLPKCNYCHASLSCEVQIMPQLLQFLVESNDNGSLDSAKDSLDWATIVVYTCEASCEASVAYKEEFAWVQLYPDEHT